MIPRRRAISSALPSGGGFTPLGQIEASTRWPPFGQVQMYSRLSRRLAGTSHTGGEHLAADVDALDGGGRRVGPEGLGGGGAGAERHGEAKQLKSHGKLLSRR